MRKKASRWIAVWLAVLMVVSLLPAAALPVEAAAKPKLAKKSASIVIGETSRIKVKNAPKGATISYKSDNKKVASVSKKGVVKGLKSGTAKIVVSVKKKSKTTKLTYKATVKKPALSKKSVSLKTGQSAQLSVKNRPKKATYAWKSSAPRIASVDNKGKVTAKAQGAATIQARVKTAKKTYTLSCKATVKKTGGNVPDSKPEPTLTPEPEPEPENPKQDLGVLTSDITGASVNTEEEAVFMLELPNKAMEDAHIYLLKGSEQIGEMHDDGKDGDAVAQDGIYSYKTICYSETETTEEYKAACEDSVSNIVEIRYFGVLSENDIAVQEQYIELFNDIEGSYTSVDGDADIEKIVQGIYQKALEGKKDGNILSASKEEDSVQIRFSSGIWYIYQPEQEGIDASGSDADVSIMTLQPYLSSYNAIDKRKSTEATDGSAEKIAGQFTNHIFDKNYDDSDVTLDVVKNFSADQIVLCHTHGYYSPNIGSVLWLGEKAHSTQWWTEKKYVEDYSAGRIVFTKNFQVGVTSAFISKYLGDLDNSVIYLGACLSGKDSRLAQSFLNKNAEAVIGNSETIWRDYNCNMMQDVAEDLLKYNESAQRYNTLSEALAYAKEKNGENDYVYRPSDAHAPSTPLIFGNGDYRLKEPTVIEADSVRLNSENVSMYVGNTIMLTATVTPDNATDQTVTWNSSAPNIASVDNGRVIGISAGTATITARTSNGKTAACTVQVNPTIPPVVEPTGITLSQSSASIDAGGEITLTATVTPGNATNKTVTWSSSAPNIAAVNNGRVTGISAGTATITARTSNGRTAACTVQVNPTVVEPTGITLDQSSVSVWIGGESITLTATVAPDNAADKTVLWSSSDPDIVTVNNGEVIGISEGTVTITATTCNGKTASCEVTAKCVPEEELDPDPFPDPYPGLRN